MGGAGRHGAAIHAIVTCLPANTTWQAGCDAITIAGQRYSVLWTDDPEKRVGDADILCGRRYSAAQRQTLRDKQQNWADSSGGCDIGGDNIAISRTGRAVSSDARWTASTLVVCETLLAGAKPTVAHTSQASGLSIAACATALRALTNLELLQATASRGRNAGRQIIEPAQLLAAYLAAAPRRAGKPTFWTVGATDARSLYQQLSCCWPEGTWQLSGVAALSLRWPHVEWDGTAAITTVEHDVRAAAEAAGMTESSDGPIVLTATSVRRNGHIASLPAILRDLQHRGQQQLCEQLSAAILDHVARTADS